MYGFVCELQQKVIPHQQSSLGRCVEALKLPFLFCDNASICHYAICSLCQDIHDFCSKTVCSPWTPLCSSLSADTTLLLCQQNPDPAKVPYMPLQTKKYFISTFCPFEILVQEAECFIFVKSLLKEALLDVRRDRMQLRSFLPKHGL